MIFEISIKSIIYNIYNIYTHGQVGREDFTRLALETRLTEFNLGTGTAEASVARLVAQCGL